MTKVWNITRTKLSNKYTPHKCFSYDLMLLFCPFMSLKRLVVERWYAYKHIYNIFHRRFITWNSNNGKPLFVCLCAWNLWDCLAIIMMSCREMNRRSAGKQIPLWGWRVDRLCPPLPEAEPRQGSAWRSSLSHWGPAGSICPWTEMW